MISYQAPLARIHAIVPEVADMEPVGAASPAAAGHDHQEQRTERNVPDG
jgi:hypothetical protein